MGSSTIVMTSSSAQRLVLAAIAMVLIGSWFIALNDAIAKLLSDRLPVSQLVWGRNLFYVLWLLPVILWWHGRGALATSRPAVQIVRGILLLAATGLGYLAISMMPLADAVALAFVYPCIATALSPLVLGDRIGPWRWGAVLLGFVGALVIIRPGAEVVHAQGALLALACGFTYAFYVLLTRKVATSDPPLVTFAVTGLVGLTLSSLALPFAWAWPTAAEWALLSAIGGVTAIGHVLMITAYRMARPAQLAPFHYMEVAASAVYGSLLFDRLPDATTWIGIAIVVMAGVLIAWREGVKGAGTREPEPGPA